MKKPEFSKPFDHQHARAGAPYCCANGQQAEILHYAVKKLIGMIKSTSGEPYSADWNDLGLYFSNSHNRELDLVMLPLGYIDGKPVFWEDELVGPYGEKVKITECGINISLCSWPAPAKVYPESTMRHDSMFQVYAIEVRELGYNEATAETRGLKAVANAALRHAIDAGQVVASDDVEIAKSKSYLDGVHAVHGPARAARDMAIAEAVRDAFMRGVRYRETYNPKAITAGGMLDMMRLWGLKGTILEVK